MLYGLVQGFIDLVYPPKCCLCKKIFIPQYKKNYSYSYVKPRANILCPDCFNRIKFNFPPFCVKCSRHLGKVVKHNHCPTCRANPPSFDFAWSACIYDAALKKLVHDFKYNQKTLLRHVLPQKIITFINKYNFDIAQFDCIVPIPLSKTRMRERGYNQSLLLAEKISCYYQIPLCKNNLIRIKNTKPHASLHQKERWTNIKAAFKIKNSCEFKNKNVLLLDDLLTTGATCSQAAFVLKECGAKIVGVLTLGTTL